MSCCLGSSPFCFWKHLDIVRHIEFKNAFPQIRSRERKFEQGLDRGVFWSRLSNLITIPDCLSHEIFISGIQMRGYKLVMEHASEWYIKQSF